MAQDGAALERLVEIVDEGELAAAALDIGRDIGGLTLLIDRFATSPDARLLRAVAYPLARATWDDAYGPAALNHLVLRFIDCTSGSPDPHVLAGAAVAVQGLCLSGALDVPPDARPALTRLLRHGLAHDDANVRDACCGAVEALDGNGGLARLLWAGPAAALRSEAARHRASVASASS